MNASRVADIVARVVADAPEVAETVDALAPAHRAELARIVDRDGVTPEAALAVLRGRQAAQRAEAARQAEARAIADAIRR